MHIDTVNFAFRLCFLFIFSKVLYVFLFCFFFSEDRDLGEVLLVCWNFETLFKKMGNENQMKGNLKGHDRSFPFV